MPTYLAAGLALFLGLAQTAPVAQTNKPVGQRFAWLAGCWKGQQGTTKSRETWQVVSDDLMIGMGSSLLASGKTEFEYLRLQGGADGAASYISQPGGAPPTSFALETKDAPADTFMFVNLQHDFPKRIAYRRVDGNNVVASIDGGPADPKRLEYPMQRTSCPSGR